MTEYINKKITRIEYLKKVIICIFLPIYNETKNNYNYKFLILHYNV
jgi:hypothetical protein